MQFMGGEERERETEREGGERKKGRVRARERV